MFSEVFYFQNTYHAQLQFSQEIKHVNLQQPTLDTTVSINYEISCFYNYVVSPFSKHRLYIQSYWQRVISKIICAVSLINKIHVKRNSKIYYTPYITEKLFRIALLETSKFRDSLFKFSTVPRTKEKRLVDK